MDPIQPIKKSNTSLIAGIVGVVVIAGAVIFAVKNNQSNSQPVAVAPVDTTNTAPVTTPASSTTPADVAPTSKYKDGTYSADGYYSSPGGNDAVHVTLVLKNDIVTDATVTSGAGDGTSARYQAMFIGGYKAYVVGQDISTLNLTKVSGSSLTPRGFNDAVSKIKTQATA